MVILAVDFGDVRTGVAICDKLEMIASPVGIVTERDFDTCVEKVADIAIQRLAEEIVVGYPKNMNNTIGERAELCQKFADALHEKSRIPVTLWDERCTTVEAHASLNVTNTRGRKRKAVLDSVAAVFILENYLAFRKNRKEREG